ncbi:MAG: CDP-archaeol synthase [Desulfurococcaceae archaeon]
MIEPSDFATWFLKYYLPPMIANAMPVLIEGRCRVDRGIVFIDGKPLLGRNKTWEGLLSGLTGAYIAGSIIAYFTLDPGYPLVSLGAGAFALLGDLLGAFIKRRLGLKPGEPFVPLDQLDFALASTLYYYTLGLPEFTLKPSYVVLSLILILVLHITTNYLAYLAGLKRSKL